MPLLDLVQNLFNTEGATMASIALAFDQVGKTTQKKQEKEKKCGGGEGGRRWKHEPSWCLKSCFINMSSSECQPLTFRGNGVSEPTF